MALAKINRVALFRAECNTAEKSAVDLYPEYPGPFSREDDSYCFSMCYHLNGCAGRAKTNKKGLSGMLRPVSILVYLIINVGFRCHRFGKRQYRFPEQ